MPRLGPGRSIGGSNPPFSSWLGFLPSFFCARLTHVFGTAFQASCGTRFLLPKTDGRGAAGPDVPAPWHGRGREAAGRGGPSGSLSPWNSRHQRATSTASWLRRRAGFQPLSAADLADLWDSLWFLLMAAADGKLSENFSPLENEWGRQDQLRWFARDDPPPLQQPELLKWRHWRPGKIREMEPTTQRALELHNGRNGSLPTSPLRSTLHICRTSWGRTSARKHWTSWGTAGSGRSGNIAWSTRVSARGTPSPQVQEELIGGGAHGHGHQAAA